MRSQLLRYRWLVPLGPKQADLLKVGSHLLSFGHPTSFLQYLLDQLVVVARLIDVKLESLGRCGRLLLWDRGVHLIRWPYSIANEILNQSRYFEVWVERLEVELVDHHSVEEDVDFGFKNCQELFSF